MIATTDTLRARLAHLEKIEAHRAAESRRISEELHVLHDKLEAIYIASKASGDYESTEQEELETCSQIKALLEERREYGTLPIRQEIGKIRADLAARA